MGRNSEHIQPVFTFWFATFEWKHAKILDIAKQWTFFKQRSRTCRNSIDSSKFTCQNLEKEVTEWHSVCSALLLLLQRGELWILPFPSLPPFPFPCLPIFAPFRLLRSGPLRCSWGSGECCMPPTSFEHSPPASEANVFFWILCHNFLHFILANFKVKVNILTPKSPSCYGLMATTWAKDLISGTPT